MHPGLHGCGTVERLTQPDSPGVIVDEDVEEVRVLGDADRIDTDDRHGGRSSLVVAALSLRTVSSTPSTLMPGPSSFEISRCAIASID